MVDGLFQLACTCLGCSKCFQTADCQLAQPILLRIQPALKVRCVAHTEATEQLAPVEHKRRLQIPHILLNERLHHLLLKGYGIDPYLPLRTKRHRLPLDEQKGIELSTYI